MRQNAAAVIASTALAVVMLVGCRQAPTARPSATPPAASQELSSAQPPASPFTGEAAMRHIEYLSEQIGPRPPGSESLQTAVQYVVNTLKEAGYEAQQLSFELPNGQTAANIMAIKQGDSDQDIVLAAHLDTVPGSPGANDDASGVAAILELAAVAKDLDLPRSVSFVFFTAEEAIEGFDEHGYSSLKFLQSLEPEQIQNMIAVCWMDKISAGPTFKIIYLGDARDSTAKELLDLAEKRGMKPSIVVAKRWSKEMAFEDYDIPTAWIEYGPAPQLHKPADDISNVDAQKLTAVGQLLCDWITGEPQP